MAARVRRVNYCYLTVPSRAGEGVKVLGELKEAGVNLLAFSGFPTGGGKAQLDVVAEDIGAIRRIAKKAGWRLSATKKAFLVQGDDTPGSAWRQLQKLADEKISITASGAVAAGQGRYGMVFWVKPKDYARAAKALGAK